MIFETIDELNEYIDNGGHDVSVLGCTVAGELLESMRNEAAFARKWGYDRHGVLTEFYMGEGEEITCNENGIIDYEHLYIG
jgi:hypothetical protein